MKSAPHLEHYLENLPAFDWDYLPGCLEGLDQMFDYVLADPQAFFGLFRHALDCPVRSRMHEVDDIRTRFVLFDHPTGNFRLRLHFWNSRGPRIIHSHRFDYAARILNGGYSHTVYSCGEDLFPADMANAREAPVAVKDVPRSLSSKLPRIHSVYSHRLAKGQSYIQACTKGVLSDTLPLEDTVSLFVRGPARHSRAFQWDPDLDTVVWKRGEKDLSKDERAQVELSPAMAQSFLEKLEHYKVFSSH
jgi:hypothetical protein